MSESRNISFCAPSRDRLKILGIVCIYGAACTGCFVRINESLKAIRSISSLHQLCAKILLNYATIKNWRKASLIAEYIALVTSRCCAYYEESMSALRPDDREERNKYYLAEIFLRPVFDSGHVVDEL